MNEALFAPELLPEPMPPMEMTSPTLSQELPPVVSEPEQDEFDELVGMLANSPTEDTTAELVGALNRVFADAEAMQDINRISQMSMVLGAMACLHPHLEGLSNELSRRYLSHGHDHKNDEDEQEDG